MGQLQFIVSLQFLKSPLDKIVADLLIDNMKIIVMHGQATYSILPLQQHKVANPYEYMDSFTALPGLKSSNFHPKMPSTVCSLSRGYF